MYHNHTYVDICNPCVKVVTSTEVSQMSIHPDVGAASHETILIVTTGSQRMFAVLSSDPFVDSVRTYPEMHP